MGDDWADEEVPMDNIEQVFIKLSFMTRMRYLGLGGSLKYANHCYISANYHDGRAARG